MWKLFIFSVLGFGVCVGQIVQNGQCDENINLQSDFDIDNFLGTWYEYARAEHSQGGDCSTIDFTRVDNETIAVYHKTVRQNFFEDYSGTATVEDGTAKISLNLPQISSNPIDYWVLTTEYEFFALVYGCVDISMTQRQVYIWQLGRNTNFEQFEMMPVLMNNTMMTALGINSNDLRYIDHSEQACYELPTIEAGQPIVLPGQCDDNITVVQDFDAARFLGVWHEISSYHSENAVGTCARAQYSSENGSVVDVINSQVVNQALLTIEGYATVISADGSGRLNVVLEVAPDTFAESELLIIATDYDRWAISYTCNNIEDNQRRVFSWIVSRTRQLPASAQAEVDAIVSSILDLNPQYYQETDQSNSGCFYFPEASDDPAVFGGQCDLTIPVVQDFNAADYLGLWHDIESYPTPFQFGTCANAFYSLGDVGVNVFNTQVVNETLNTINGVAVPVGNEGKLVVSFPIEGTNLTTETDYWIISTNYNSYSLVYSCRNINDYQQQITVWKLSRTKSLEATAITAINAAMATLPVLDQRYFQPVDQSPEGCFYYPEPTGLPVVFPGQCVDVPVVTNFNVNLFQGIWYEVEAYPKDFQPGQCVSHQFSPSNTDMGIVSNSVDDQLLGVSSGQLTFVAGTNASFTLTINSTGSQPTFPYHIVDTDYENYALAYSCVNQGNDFRAVYAWKLSREKELSANARAAITAAMDGIETLGNEYFEPIDQSDDACFYFPDIAPGEPVILPGQCDNDIAFVTDFDAAAYLGRWRLIESYPSDNQNGSCNQASYSLAGDGTVIVYNTEVANDILLEATGVGVLSVQGNQTIGKLDVTFPGATEPFELWILDTDYDSYSLVYGCKNVNTAERRVWSWKMSRTTNLTTEAINAIDAIINNVTVLNQRYYETVDHSDEACFYFPELTEGETVIFRGQCDENLPVVMEFDPVGYMGLWHDIERYPAPFQDGTCGNAFYTLDTVQGIVDVYNTQVLNQTLDTINGFAVLDQVDADDTSAKLLVTFPVGGFNLTTPYWVLATDYDSYALVYSCSNIDSEYRSVTSWKLSRTKSLTNNAIEAINNVTNTIKVLDERYYISQDQTPEGCFYFPEPEPGVPVVFPGQCDLNLNVVQNFSMAQFQGVWHEIETYPKVEQDGQCINHAFTLNGTNVLGLESFNIIAQSLGITTGTVSFSLGNNNDGRLSLVFTTNGTDIEIPYWIVDTDYDNYALVYSCVDQNDDYRGVWSWKLSRTKELSITSSIAIDNAIADIDILDNIYFEQIDQSDEACFYLPDVTGGPVIFPGQCDTNITGIPNFNATEYLGLWRLIETYPSEFQLGTCGDATYSLGGDGTVVVVNTEVINQYLSTIEGSAVASGDGTGKLFVTFPGAPEPAEYLILGTDYDNYALVYSCSNINSDQRKVYSWKLSRSNTLSQAAVNEINTIVDNINVLNDIYYEVTDRSDEGCFYYPELNEAATVVFRGQCDDNLPVVMEFDPVGYMGLWHDIERYPAPFQDGTCGNAFYTLDTVQGIVDVYNTQVLNQTLDTINGFAVLDQIDINDTSAKLLVTFPVGGFNLSTPYWVLATDYDSYALVYSCSNIDSEHRSVTSWKLSRTKSLTNTAIEAINNVTNTINVLDERYYISQDQTPEGCFYFPEPEPGTPVVFPGQCDLNLNVVQNFSMAQFQGVWHEIETYPKVEQDGQCINHAFTLNGTNVLGLESFNIIAQSLGITTGTVSFSLGNNNDGRLSLVFTTNGTDIEIPYWIVDTDYDNYALVYSCVDQNADYRGVWSWKLSRTKELSINSSIAIDNAIADIDILDNIYFERIDQSDEACFYLPDVTGGPVIFPGQCDTNITGIPNFNATEYLGLWRLIETYPSEFQLGTCGDATYSLGEDGTVVVVNTEVINQYLSTIEGSAVASDDGTGKLFVTFPGAPEPAEYLILGTDYDNYALVYSCSNINSDQRKVYSWKLSRSNTLSQAAVNEINTIVENINVLNDIYYEVTDRSDEGCFYYPELNEAATIVFRGQCDDNLPVVMEFDPVGYMGLWHDIERYPAPFQDGTCGNAFYTLDTVQGIVDVYNTQVLNQTLDTINGFAVLDQIDTNDTSAKLLVTFPVGGFNLTTPYWVLATDYDSYALVYSCSNIGTEHRSVTSWKLSRTKSLTNTAIQAINAVTNTINVLDERYYISQDQTPEGCFYFPEPEPGVPVVFPGLCDLNLDVVQNFSLAQFQGTWHEIEGYPKEEQIGECINHEFTLNAAGSSLNFQSSNVVAQSLGFTSGTVTFTSNDQSARLQLVFTNNGTTITIPYWIIDTDYENYALAYSCVNQVGSDYRGVWSWKLSRTRQLSAESSSAINNAIANVDILDNRYFEPISQSDESCFYLPDLAPGEPVIFPGQCDTNITVVTGFDASRYLGLWRLIESYPSEFQLGSCGDATYSLGENGIVAVYNTEVVNQTLSTIDGSAVLTTDDGRGILTVTFPNAPPIDYYILDTDYDNYALVYSCVNIGTEQRRVFSWKLSRNNFLSQEAINAIDEIVNNVNVLDDRYYQEVDRSDDSCFYFPEPDGNPVVFRGQCDDNTTVIANFDATRYMGIWYNVESYPAEFQDGTCGTATYTLDPETLVVYVENSQVRNPGLGPVLDVQTGTAVLASDDGSGKLLVTFEVNGLSLTSDYWVLDTDYDNFALVYSCQNINEEYRQVNSFKLGRDKSFNAQSVSAITAAINQVQVLEERYFEDGRQSEADCFFYPDNNGGDVLLNGQCLDDNLVPVITNFNADAFDGTWYELARFPSDMQEGECTNIEYSIGSQNSINISLTTVQDEFQTTNVIFGSVTTDGRGVINVDMAGVPFNIYVLDTDYEEFALLYGCRNIGNSNKQVYSWKLSRSSTGFSAYATERINELVYGNVDLFEGYYSDISQTNDACFHYPEYEELPDTIELLGPCNENIRGIANFDATAYLGRWIEIEKYPQRDQFGTCDRAYYSSGDDGVLVRNTHVLNEALAEQLGSAVVASDDGSGLLNVTFVVNGLTVFANYYILATDYTHYALVYSCRDLDNGNRQVSSWKLSRTTSLTPQAITAINDTIAQTQGLHQPYYTATSQTAEDCFYIPEVDVNAAPVYRGQCENMPGLDNFDPVSFAGWWHEIERFPVNNYRGECISSQYQTIPSGYQMIDTVVANGTALLDTGTVEVFFDGRLRRHVNGELQADIWVLATDYNTYALLYSCENIDSEHRQVWSAKHSKSRQLTQAAQNAMLPAIEANRVLYTQFYQTVDQSDAACFHYPELTGQQVILPGQCDENIPVMQGFNVAAYGGTWYQIERYPQLHENPSSTCIGARYILNEATGVVTVTNWEVIDGVLETIEGTATLTSSDGSGKLEVVLPVVGTNDTVATSLYVLDTDYESYSLVYSCSNLNNYQRSIGAWKLSRERSMSPAGTTAINAIINQREELHHPYFIQVHQDEDCEELSGGALLKSSILVMIICALWQILS